MKARKVKLNELRDSKLWEFNGKYNYLVCHQMKAQVVKEDK